MSVNHKPYVQPGDALPDFLRRFWQRQVATAEKESPDWKHPSLPIARIKKVMKSDPDVKVMIASDGALSLGLGGTHVTLTHRPLAPILFCKACEIFIAEITARAFLIADSNKRRTLSRADIAKALSKSDQFDFLIDIVPREDPYAVVTSMAGMSSSTPQQQPQAQSLEDVSGGLDLQSFQGQYHADNIPNYATMTHPDAGLGPPDEQRLEAQLGEDEDSGVMLQRLNTMLCQPPGMER